MCIRGIKNRLTTTTCLKEFDVLMPISLILIISTLRFAHYGNHRSQDDRESHLEDINHMLGNREESVQSISAK